MTAPSSGSAGPRVFATPAFLREVEPGTFMVYRSIEVEVLEEGTGRTVREKMRDLAVSPFPLREFDPAVDAASSVVLRTVHPTTGRLLRLVKVPS